MHYRYGGRGLGVTEYMVGDRSKLKKHAASHASERDRESEQAGTLFFFLSSDFFYGRCFYFFFEYALSFTLFFFFFF